MKLKSTVLLLGFAVLGVTSYFMLASSPAEAVDALVLSAEPEGVADAPPVVSSTVAEPDLEGGAAQPTRSEVEAPLPEQPVLQFVAKGVVVDMGGRSESYARVIGKGAGTCVERALADADGRFVLSARQALERIESDDPEYVTVLAGRPDASGSNECVVVIGRAVVAGGIVTDKAGVPIAGAAVEAVLDSDLRAHLSVALDPLCVTRFTAVTAMNGRFSLGRIPKCEETVLVARAKGFRTSHQRLPGTGSTEHHLMLVRTNDESPRVRGRVVDEANLPVQHALVTLRAESTRSDAQGEFEIEVVEDPKLKEFARHLWSRSTDRADRAREAIARHLVAFKAGFLPAAYEGAVTASGLTFPEYVQLQLGPADLAITGRVERADGTLYPGVRVWLGDPTLLATDTRGELIVLENAVAGNASDWRWVTSDEAGNFEIDGLANRTYQLIAMSNTSVEQCTVDDVPAGARNVVVRFAADALHPIVSGRVVTRDRTGVAGARIRATREAVHRMGTTRMESGAVAITDADGRFILRDVPKSGVYLRINGDGFAPMQVGKATPTLAAAVSDVTAIEIVVTRERRFRIELQDAARASDFSLLDGTGTQLTIYEVSGPRRTGSKRLVLANGRSSELNVLDTATTLVLYRDDREVDRALIQFTGEDVTVWQR